MMLPKIERLYMDAEAHEHGLSGVVLPYGELAPRIGYQLQVEHGSLAGRMDDVLLNVQHDETQLLGRTGPDGNVHLTDTEKSLLISFRYPDTQLGKDVKALVDHGVLRGFSAELAVLSDDWAGGVRRMTKGALTGIGLVARPAMRGAKITQKLAIEAVKAPLEGGLIAFKTEQLARREMSGELQWDEPSIASMARREAVLFKPDSLNTENPVTLMLGSDYNMTAANTADNGALQVQKTNSGLRWRVRNMPRTENGEKILQLAGAGLITGWRAGFIPLRSEKSKVKLMGIDMDLTIVSEGILCEVRLTSDGTGGAGQVRGSRRSRRRR